MAELASILLYRSRTKANDHNLQLSFPIPLAKPPGAGLIAELIIPQINNRYA